MLSLNQLELASTASSPDRFISLIKAIEWRNSGLNIGTNWLEGPSSLLGGGQEVKKKTKQNSNPPYTYVYGGLLGFFFYMDLRDTIVQSTQNL